MKANYLIIVFGVFVFFPAIGQSNLSEDVAIIDESHYSHVFAEMRNFRIFLPPHYDGKTNKRYPVIYFMHGWSQRYFGSGGNSYSEYDQLDQNNGDNIAKFVSEHEVIVVKSDGYNRTSDEEYYVRPYNVGPVETHRQFPIYFEELIRHIDREYPTRADRAHRAISGLSMGGFMTFFIAGKYPHLFGAAGSFCGSPEFVIGPKEIPVEYRHLDMYQNYDGMKIRLHYGDQDFIRSYHEDLNRVWSHTMDHYSYKVFPGEEHTTSGLGEMFTFLMNTFDDPLSEPSKWNHIDIYPEFKVWDFSVSTDRDMPGFTLLENVDKRGFKCSVREFLPDGPILSQVQVSVITGPIYKKNQAYIINDYDLHSQSFHEKQIMSDELGSIKITLNGGIHHIGINELVDAPNLSLLEPVIENAAWATVRTDINLSISLVNKGLANSGGLKATLSAESDDIIISKAASTLPPLAIGQTQKCKSPFSFRVTDNATEKVKLRLDLTDTEHTWIEYFYLDLKPQVEHIENYQIADGGTFIVAARGNEFDTIKIGQGNADGIPNPGESIEILVSDQEILRRTKIYSSSPCINPQGIHIRTSDYWGRYDNVGASVKNSTLVLASVCSQQQPIDLFIEYWLPDKPLHVIKRGKITIVVEGQDETPPDVVWAKVSGKNLLQVKVRDGSTLQKVVGTFIQKEKEAIKVILNDVGTDGDQVGDDQVFSIIIPPREFGFYQLTLELVDSYENKTTKSISKPFILHR